MRRIGQQGLRAGWRAPYDLLQALALRANVTSRSCGSTFRPFGELKKDVGPTEGSFTDHAADDAVAGISGRVARVVILSGVNDDCRPAGLKH